MSGVSALEKNMYATAGKLLAYSVVHRGPVPRFFSAQLYACLTDGYTAAVSSVDDIDDADVKNNLNRVCTSHNLC